MSATEAARPGKRVTFWYGCNVLRHGDIIHACIDVLRALGFDPSPAGGPDFCCGSTKDGNAVAADGMAQRTVERFNKKGADRVVAWCPSCHLQSYEFMEKAYQPKYDMQYFMELVYEHREALRPLLKHPVPMRVFVHRHVGFNDKVPVNEMAPELLSMIPGLEVVEDNYRGPGYMCAHLATVPAAMTRLIRETEARMRRARADALVTLYHQCQRELVGLETQGVTQVYNYMQLVARSMGLAYEDEYKAWKKAGQDAAAGIDPEKLQKVGIQFFDRAVLPELLKKTPR
ncbi:MAG TPA: (Fe-S)-binding protein [Burkholderiales bacterium]|nr:(Fe-S)-binding protein [Burkholderiales bacterium]